MSYYHHYHQVGGLSKSSKIGVVVFVIAVIVIIVSVLIWYFVAGPGKKKTTVTYKFHQGKDSSGGDLSHRSELADNITGLQSWCSAESTCKGFNTNGFFKTSIQPEAQWKQWTTDPKKGLYTKV